MWVHSDGNLAKSCSTGCWMSQGMCRLLWTAHLDAQWLVDQPGYQSCSLVGLNGLQALHWLTGGSDASQHRLSSLRIILTPRTSSHLLTSSHRVPKVMDPPCPSPLPVLVTFTLSPSLLSGLYYSMASMLPSPQGFLFCLWISKSLGWKERSLIISCFLFSVSFELSNLSMSVPG